MPIDKLKKIQDNLAHAVCKLFLSGDTKNANRVLKIYEEKKKQIQKLTGRVYP